MSTKKQIDSIKSANKKLAQASSDILVKSVGSASFFGGLFLKLGLRFARHKSVLYANSKITELMIKNNIKDDKVKRSKNKKDLIKYLRNSQW